MKTQDHAAANQQQDRLLRLPQVLALIPISKSSWWSGIKTCRYPAGRKLSERTTVWLESEVMAVVNGTFQEGR